MKIVDHGLQGSSWLTATTNLQLGLKFGPVQRTEWTMVGQWSISPGQGQLLREVYADGKAVLPAREHERLSSVLQASLCKLEASTTMEGPDKDQQKSILIHREGWGLQGLDLVCLGMLFFELFLLSVRVRKDLRVRMLVWGCNSFLSLHNILFSRLSSVCWVALGVWFWVLTLPLTIWVTL